MTLQVSPFRSIWHHDQPNFFWWLDIISKISFPFVSKSTNFCDGTFSRFADIGYKRYTSIPGVFEYSRKNHQNSGNLYFFITFIIITFLLWFFPHNWLKQSINLTSEFLLSCFVVIQISISVERVQFFRTYSNTISDHGLDLIGGDPIFFLAPKLTLLYGAYLLPARFNASLE